MTSITNLKQMNWDRQNEEAYDELVVSIEASLGELNLLIGVCNNSDFREQIIQRYEKELQLRTSQGGRLVAHPCPPELRCYRVTLLQKEPSLRAAIAELVQKEEYLQQKEKAVITVTGVEKLSFLKGEEKRSEQEKFLGYLQWTREALRDFPYSIILWITSSMEATLPKKAPDFWSWRKGIFRFISRQNNSVSLEEVVSSLQASFQSLEELPTKKNVPLFSSEDLISLIEKIESTEGKKDLRLATLYASLGQIYQNQLEQGNSQEYQEELKLAIEYYSKAIELQKELNLELDLANSFNNLALLYKSQRKHEEAAILAKQALEISKRLLGENYSHVVTSLNNLASIYHSQGRYEEAEPLYKQALSTMRGLLGENHPDIAISLNNLAELYRSKKRYEEAEHLFQQSLAVARQTLGENHPYTQTIANNWILIDVRKYINQ